MCLAILRGLEVGDEAIDGGFVLRVGQGEMDAIGIEIACASTANPAYALSVQKNVGRRSAQYSPARGSSNERKSAS